MQHFWVDNRNTLTNLLSRLRGKRLHRKDGASLDSPIVAAIHAREIVKLPTTLGELHQITNLTQVEALRAVARLERAGIVKIEPDHNDAFKSAVCLSKDARWRLDRGRNAERS